MKNVFGWHPQMNNEKYDKLKVGDIVMCRIVHCQPVYGIITKKYPMTVKQYSDWPLEVKNFRDGSLGLYRVDECTWLASLDEE